MMRVLLTITALLLCFSFSAICQNLDKIGTEKPLKVNGGVNLSQIVYGIRGAEMRRDPYNYFLTGNLNFSIYGYSVPLSFSFSNQNLSFRQPFNQVGFSPTYKWITLHAGYRSMNFSSYSLNGHIFLGLGADLQPSDKLHVSVMYGRLLRRTNADTLQGIPPAFDRWGYGAKVGYQVLKKTRVEASVFASQDRENSIPFIPEGSEILPEENLVFDLGLQQQIGEKISFFAELASSALTRDIRNDRQRFIGTSVYNATSFLLQPTISTEVFHAMKGGVNYNGGNYTIGGGYERIDPGYRSHGAYFFNSDLENFTVNGNVNLWQGKLSVNTNTGIQRNNLSGERLNQTSRFVGALNLNSQLNEKTNVTLSYTNFQTFVVIRSEFDFINELTPFDNFDTLNFTQLNQSLNANVNYSFGNSKEIRNNINVNLAVQDATDRRGGVKTGEINRFYNANANYSYSHIPSQLTLTTAVNYNFNQSVIFNQSTVGPTVGANRTFLNKVLRSGLSTSYNLSRMNGENSVEIWNFRVFGAYTLAKKHVFNLSTVVLHRNILQGGNSNASNFSELTCNLNYSYSF